MLGSPERMPNCHKFVWKPRKRKKIECNFNVWKPLKEAKVSQPHMEAQEKKGAW